ncbi:MAG: hypothetical protein C0436_01710 [Alphaproteobacteria bacterium]|nr:hypothetical protein [Alphaproteobacteria bacterium]
MNDVARGVNIATGQPIEQLSQIARTAQNGIGALSAIVGAFWAGLDFLWNTIIVGVIAFIAYHLMPESWQRQIGEWLGQGAEMAAGTVPGRSLFNMIDGLAERLGFGRPIEGRIVSAATAMNPDQFAQHLAQSGLNRAVADALHPLRGELARRGINAQNALQAGQRNPDGTYQDGNIEFLLKNLSTDKLGTLFDALRNSGTPEQRNANRDAIQLLLRNEEVLRILNERHRPLIGRIAASLLQGADGQPDLTIVKQLVSTPQGLATLAAAVPAIPPATITSLGVTQAQLQSAISDMQANNPRGQAYRTLIANDMLPVLGSIGQRLQGPATLTSALDVLRTPALRERLSNPEIVSALARVAPENAPTRALFTSVRGTDGTVSYPTITAGLQLVAHIDSGTEQQRAQRAAAVTSLDTVLRSGALPAAGSPERAALQGFFGDESNRTALRAFASGIEPSSLTAGTQEQRLIALLRGPHADAALRILADDASVRWLEEHRNTEARSIAGVRAWATMPPVISQNSAALEPLRETLQPPAAAAAATPQRTSSLTEPSIAEQIQQAAGAARIAGVANATVAVGAPNVADLTRLPVREPSASTVIG